MKKKIILIVIFVTLILLGFVGYKLVILHEYQAENSAIDINSIFNEKMHIDNKESNDTIKFEEMSYYNYFADYVSKENSDFKVKYNDNNEVVSFYNIVKDKQYINVLSLNSFVMSSDNEEDNQNFDTEQDMQELLDKNNIKDDVDLLNYIKNNYYFRSSIFTCNKTIRNNYILNIFVSVAFPEFKNITLIEGSVRGYIINTTSTSNVKEIHLLHNNNQYIITLSGQEITNDNFINTLLESIRFK